MLYNTKKSWFFGLMASLLFSGLFSACTLEEPLSRNAQIFCDQTLEDFYVLRSKLIPALEGDNPITAAGAVIEDYLLDLHNAGRRILGVGLLDISGEYITGCSLEDKNSGELKKDKYKGMNFASFEGVERIVNSREIVQVPLYLQDARVLVIGFPLVDKDNLLGIAYFSFNSRDFMQKWGIGEEEFLQIDFNDEQ
jgi:hypothetical protein